MCALFCVSQECLAQKLAHSRNLHLTGAEQERQDRETHRSNKSSPFSSSAMLPVPLLGPREGSFHFPWGEYFCCLDGLLEARSFTDKTLIKTLASWLRENWKKPCHPFFLRFSSSKEAYLCFHAYGLLNNCLLTDLSPWAYSGKMWWLVVGKSYMHSSKPVGNVCVCVFVCIGAQGK